MARNTDDRGCQAITPYGLLDSMLYEIQKLQRPGVICSPNAQGIGCALGDRNLRGTFFRAFKFPFILVGLILNSANLKQTANKGELMGVSLHRSVVSHRQILKGRRHRASIYSLGDRLHPRPKVLTLTFKPKQHDILG